MKSLLLRSSLAACLSLAAILLTSCDSDPYYGGPGYGYGQSSGYYSQRSYAPGPYYSSSPYGNTYYPQRGGAYAYRSRPDYYGNQGYRQGYGYPVQPSRPVGNYSSRSSNYDRPPSGNAPRQPSVNMPRPQNQHQSASRPGGSGRPPSQGAAPGPVSSKNLKLEEHRRKKEEERRR